MGFFFLDFYRFYTHCLKLWPSDMYLLRVEVLSTHLHKYLGSLFI